MKHRLPTLKSKHAFVDHLHPGSPCSRCVQRKKVLSKHTFVDHLHPRSPCSRCLQRKKVLGHPLRGASLRSAPHSSRNEYHVFPLRALPAMPLPCLAQDVFQGALTKAPTNAQESSQRSSPRGSQRSSRGALPEVQKSSPRCSQRSPRGALPEVQICKSLASSI